jgi:hypothetical protein
MACRKLKSKENGTGFSIITSAAATPRPTPGENAALVAALEGYAKRSGPDDFSSVADFLGTHPQSSWRASLLNNLGTEYYRVGYYSKALEAWRDAWQLAKEIEEPRGKAVADRACGEIAYMYARLGRMSELDTLLKSVEYRAFSGPATEKIVGAREGLCEMRTRPEVSFRCGPLALHRIKVSIDPRGPGIDLIYGAASTHQGFSLSQVAELSRKVGLGFKWPIESRALRWWCLPSYT